MFGCAQVSDSDSEVHATCTFYVDMNPISPSLKGQQRKSRKGWLLKKGGMMKIWHRRWFVLTDKMLFQFSKEDDIKPQSSYFLTSGSHKVTEHPVSPDEPEKFCFDLVPGPRLETGSGETVMLCASSGEERLGWVKDLRYVLYADIGGAIFGLNLEETMKFTRSEGKKIPAIIEKCVEYIYANGLEVEGIFRLPGRTSLIRELKEKFDCAETVSFDMLQPDVNSVASLLKMYLRELPESIIPCKLYQRYMNHALRFIDAKDDETKDKCVLDLQNAMPDMPKDNYCILKYLCKFLHDIGEKSDINKMTVNNLATVFGPNIIRHMDDNPELFMITADLTQQLAFMMIKNYETVFTLEYRDDGNIDVPEADLLRLSTWDSNPVLSPQAASQPNHRSAMQDLRSLDLAFADEVFDQLAQNSQSPNSPGSPFVFVANHFQADGENSTLDFDPLNVQSEKQSNTLGSRPIPPKRKSKIARGRRIIEKRTGSDSEGKHQEDPSKRLSESIKEALDQRNETPSPRVCSNGTTSHLNNNTSAEAEADNKVQPSEVHLLAQNEALKVELVNTKTHYGETLKKFQSDLSALKDRYEKRIDTMEAMIKSQNECLQKEKKDRAEAVERVVLLQAQLHEYQMQYGEIQHK
ncbi:rho GTPase-activating protein 24-like isoform X1 [Haliotis asinina]|uniref:rho GTPase-activating protein 24-like isoform X1 n=2 Tax=Haliotis asinina TaxID=109174 RepID=UPI003531D6E1